MDSFNYVAGNNMGIIGGENNTVINNVTTQSYGNNSIKTTETDFDKIISDIRKETMNLPTEIQLDVNGYIDVIESEVPKKNPDKNSIHKAINGIKKIVTSDTFFKVFDKMVTFLIGRL